VIQLKQVSKYYRDVAALRDLDLEVADGEILGLIGHNGAGKSTTLKILAGLIRPTSGEVRVMGHDMTRQDTAVKQWIGYLPEETPLYENLTAREYLLFFSELYGMAKPDALRRAGELLDALQLDERDKLLGEFSKGMKRKVAIARALLHDPKLLILDEPNSGLDPLTSFFIINYLRTLKGQGKTIVLSAHNLFHVEYVCDRVAIIKNGRLIVHDSMEAIRKHLGNRKYQVVFTSDAALDFERQDGNYVFHTTDVGEMAAMLTRISENRWALVDLSVQESALEEIYVKLMAA
jgi:ABC-2 type transport system ATP-binding protein